jgi:hypothetical protein
VRVDGRVAESVGDQPLEVFGEDVLEDFGLVVDTVPGHPQLLGEEELQQAVVPQHLECNSPASIGEAHAAIRLMLDESNLGQLAHHARDGSRSHPQPLG